MNNEYLEHLKKYASENILSDSVYSNKEKLIIKNYNRICIAYDTISDYLKDEYAEDNIVIEKLELAIIKSIINEFYDIDYYFTDIKKHLRDKYDYEFKKEVIKSIRK